MRHEARRVPTTFLYATDNKFLSSTVSSPPNCEARCQSQVLVAICAGSGGIYRIAYLGNLLHVCNHLIVPLGLLAEPREEGLAVEGLASGFGTARTAGRLDFLYLSR